MKKRGERGIAAVLALGLMCAVLSGCGGGGGGGGGGADGGGGGGGGGTLMGGAIQGTPLSLDKSVSTFAGALSSGSSNGVGTAARFDLPIGITTDGSNLYIADSNNNTIRKVEIATKTVTTLAGSGALGFHDDIGSAATFANPYGITISTDGKNLYVADSLNNAIRKVEIATKTVTTLAGSGAAGFHDDTGSAATFDFPQGITCDGANLYVTDGFNNAIRKVEIATKIVTTLAGTGSNGFDDGPGASATFDIPIGITTDGTTLYVADSINNAIRTVDKITKRVGTLAGSGFPGSDDGIGSAATFTSPYGVTMDGTNLYVADSDNHKIRKVVIATKDVTTIAGSGLPGSADGIGSAATFNFPYGITTDGVDLYVSDSGNNMIRVIR